MPYPLQIPPADKFRHRIPAQLRFNDIDILGHVNNTVYFSYYDTGKARYMEAVCKGDIDFRKVETVIANVDCAFIKPILFGQNIDVLTRLSEMGDKHICLQQMLVDADNGTVHSLCNTVMVYIDVKTMTPISVPPLWRRLYSEYENL